MQWGWSFSDSYNDEFRNALKERGDSDQIFKWVNIKIIALLFRMNFKIEKITTGGKGGGA